jgi:hypothetical protein
MKRLLVPLACAALALAGCSSGAPAKTAPTDIAPTADESTVPQTGPAPTKPGASPQAGCPVDPATLEKALKDDATLSDALSGGGVLKNIVCYQDYATASTEPANADPATVLFKYDGTKKMWVALTGGTDIDCAKQQVPKEVIAHLQSCPR